MAVFDRDAFWDKVMSMYPAAKESNYLLRLNEEQVSELKSIYMDIYIPVEDIEHYNDAQIMKKMMTAIVSISKLDKDHVTNGGEVVQLVNSVRFDGRYLYMHYAKISPVKMRRFELGLSQKQVSERMGYGISTVRNCEDFHCDMSRQPETLRAKLAKALNWEPEGLMANC